jgi:hypothetical protein
MSEGWNGEQKPSGFSQAVAGVIITLIVIAAITLIFATIGAMAAVLVESYQWFREALEWV